MYTVLNTRSAVTRVILMLLKIYELPQEHTLDLNPDDFEAKRSMTFVLKYCANDSK